MCSGFQRGDRFLIFVGIMSIVFLEGRVELGLEKPVGFEVRTFHETA